jgi:hypothetical protein
VRLRSGERLTLRLSGPTGSDVNLVLWEPGAESVVAFPPRGLVADVANGPGARERLRYLATRTGWYYVQVKLSDGDGGAYRLIVRKS